jgi:hypothetical protein
MPHCATLPHLLNAVFQCKIWKVGAAQAMRLLRLRESLEAISRRQAAILSVSGLLPDVPGRTHREDAFVTAREKHPFQKAAALIV